MSLGGPKQSPPAPTPQHYQQASATAQPWNRITSASDALPLSDAPLTRLELFSTRLSNPLVTSLSGALSGIASGVVTCPLDVIKTKLQAQGGFRPGPSAMMAVQSATYKGLVGTARSIWREEGVRGMYRGLFPMILGYFPTWAVYFTVYDRAKEFWYQEVGQETPQKKMFAHLLTAVTAGGCSTIVTNPIWVIKTRLMSQVNSSSHRGDRPPWHYTSTWDAARKMYLHEGVRSFYSGLSPALLGLTHVAVQFPLYEYVKFKLTGLEMGEESREESQTSKWLGMSIATVLSKFCASAATYPHEVIRTRLQTQQRSGPGVPQEDSLSREHHGRTIASNTRNGPDPGPRYRGIIHTVKTILREEGWRAFYVGMGTNMIRAVPAATTTILTYEYIVGRIRMLQAEGHKKLDLARQRGEHI